MKKIIFLLTVILLVACSGIKNSPESSLSGSVEIHDIQGCGHRSPFEGQTVENIQGVVTWKVENGFYMQSTRPDEKTCSSEGLFVFTSSYPSVLPGEEVSISGKVEEFVPGSENDHNLSVTELNAKGIKTLSNGSELPAPYKIGEAIPSQMIEDDSFAHFDPETDGLDYWESLEGMLVEVEDARVVEARNSYGEIVVIPGIVVGNNVLSSEGALVETQSDLNPERVFVELPKNYKKDINLGAQFTSPIIGVLGYEYRNYRILQQNMPEFKKLEAQITRLDPVDKSSIRVATYNLENWSRFDEDRTQQFAKDIVFTLSAPDVLMLQEVQDDSSSEDDGTITAKKNILALIHAIQDRNGPEYEYYQVDPQDGLSGGQAGANIRSVLLYRTDRIQMDKEYSITEFGLGRSAFNGVREPLIARLELGDQKVILIGVHLVSNNLNTPFFGSIQPIEKPEEEKRIRQAENIIEIANSLQMANPQTSLIILGDFNDVAYSKTLGQFSVAGFMNPFDEYPISERYSLIFEGNAQQFDQILVNQSAQSKVNNIYIVHLNTGRSERNQTSDHDPVVIDLDE
jgi:predicted extracellular nuclease